MPISIKTSDEIEKMRTAGQLAAEVLEMIGPRVQIGITIFLNLKLQELQKVDPDLRMQPF